MMETMISYAKNIVEKLNLFKLFQVLWLIEFYLLAIFSGKQGFENVCDISIKEPSLITEYSTKIRNWVVEYNGYILYLAIIFLVAGLSCECIAKLPFLRDYELIQFYANIGWYVGGWLIFILITYWFYIILNVWFVFMPIIIRVATCFFMKH